MRAWLALTVANTCALGCFSKPDYRGGDAGGDGTGSGTIEGVTVVGNGISDPIEVTSEDVVLHFPKAPLHLPDDLKVGGVSVLGFQEYCGNEGAVGLALYPAYSVNATMDSWPNGSTPTSAPVVRAKGPAFVQVAVTWGGGYTCGGTQTAMGTSTFTVFPDGRIIRDDTIEPSTTTLAMGACGCGNSVGDFYLTSFLTLNNTAFTDITYDNTVAGGPTTRGLAGIRDIDGVDGPNARWACLENRAPGSLRRLAVVWPGSVIPLADDEDHGSRIRFDPMATPNPTTALIYDWDNSNPTLAPGMRTTQVAWFADAGSGATCEPMAMERLAKTFADPRTLELGGQTIAPSPHTGIYDATDLTQASYDFTVTEGVEGIPRGFAISVKLPTDVSARATINGAPLAERRDFVTQHTPSPPYVHTLWFARPLDQGQTLTISQP